jgi:2-keto-3-deoxy-6-phosphogluconate aldolase
MSRIDLFKQHLTEKRAVKIIAGIDNFDIENIKKVVTSAEQAGASAVDICAKPEIISEIREMTDMPIFVSSVVPSELVKAVELGADAIELGNFDALYKMGMSFSAETVLSLVNETISMLGDMRTFFCVTIPGEISINDQIELARKLETMGIDLIQTEGHYSSDVVSDGARGLMERAELTLSNTIELSRNIDLPIMTATAINPTTAPFAFAAGASAIGCGSCINKMDSTLSMMATARSLVEIASRNARKVVELV